MMESKGERRVAVVHEVAQGHLTAPAAAARGGRPPHGSQRAAVWEDGTPARPDHHRPDAAAGGGVGADDLLWVQLPNMGYDVYLAQGWPIGTGVVEGAGGHLVKDRMEQAGMRWTKPGAHAVLDLRAVRLTDDWDASWAFHRQHQHERLYGVTALIPAPAEVQALAQEAAA